MHSSVFVLRMAERGPTPVKKRRKLCLRGSDLFCEWQWRVPTFVTHRFVNGSGTVRCERQC